MADASLTLAARARSGDRAAFAEAIRACQDRLYRIALGMTRNQEDARDILQDTLMSAYRALPNLQDDTRLEPWLCRIAANCARMHLRARRRRPTVPIDDVEGGFDETGHRLERTRAWDVDPADAIDRARLCARIEAFSLELPDEYREVWLLADVEHLSMAEIAEILELELANVKTRLHRARLALRKRLAAELA